MNYCQQKIEELVRSFLKQKTENAGLLKPLLVLLGPTASGKTALSIELAKKFNGEVISADSRQVYRHMDIGTDKISLRDREGIPHYLIDVANPDDRFTVVDFMKLADYSIEKILSHKALPMLVGGTGLYITALTENFQIPETGEALEIRKKLEEQMKEHGKEWLHNELAKVDPETASKIPFGSHLYVLRALEIYHATGKPKQNRKGEPKYETLKIGLRWPKEILAERIATRVENQFKNGLIDEVKKLLEMGYSPELPSMKSLGYREVVDFLNNKITLEEAKKLIVSNTVKFSKRQMTWFKRDKDIVWVDW